ALQALAREASHCSLTDAQQQAHQQLSAWAFQNRPLESAHKATVLALRLAVNNLIEPVKQVQSGFSVKLFLNSADR
ncbi:MAG TPA: hypothetical protein VLO13_00150, partial [Halomonas sp.]|nr:hypothetical protein [Halomonas sp.]